MTTYLLLALHDDGRSEAFELWDWSAFHSDVFVYALKLSAVAYGYDRGPYETYEAAGFSIDVQALPTGMKALPRFVREP